MDYGTGMVSRKSERLMLGAGLALGTLLPFGGLLLVTPKSQLSFAIFLLTSVALGGLMAWLFSSIATRASQRALASALESTHARLGTQADFGSDVDAMVDEFERLIRDVSGVLERSRLVNSEIRALTAQVLSVTEEQASGAAEQSAAVAETSATVEELAQTSKQIAENSQSVAVTAERTLASAEEGMQAVADTVGGIEDIRDSTRAASDRILALGERSQEIGRVLVIIDDIAEQTKILALNAAIEAARAGDAGKGFAIVAEEIGKFADSVTGSTSEIGGVVREIQSSASSLVMSTEKASKKVDEGKMLAKHTADSLVRIVHQAEDTTDSAKQISIATQQQRTASDQVVLSMREMAQVAVRSAESSRQVQAAILELNRLADSLDAR